MLNGEIVTVKSIEFNPVTGNHFIRIEEDFRQIITDYLSPIHLTEELLVKCDWNGFKKFHINSYFKIDEQGCIWYCGDFTGLVIKHLHRLQNFYRDITNKELTI